MITFRERDGIFKTLCVDAAGAPEKNFYLVIDEINRGDLPRIFGELMTVMELDKRDQTITLPVSANIFRIPRNVFVVGTMNTADRSISLLDAAVRRRFAFIELMPDTGCLDGRQVRGLPLGPWLSALNTCVRKHLKRDARNLQVGHAYPSTSVMSYDSSSCPRRRPLARQQRLSQFCRTTKTTPDHQQPKHNGARAAVDSSRSST